MGVDRENGASHANDGCDVFSHRAYARTSRCETGSVDSKLLMRFQCEHALVWTGPKTYLIIKPINYVW